MTKQLPTVFEHVSDWAKETPTPFYVYDEEGTLDLNSNLDSVDIFPVEEGGEDERALLALLEEHIARTGSPKASRLVADWRSARPRFAKVLPVVA